MKSTAEPRILVACIGNIFLGDDAFGVEVARRFASRTLQSNVTIKDFGIRGFDLAFALMDAYDFAILVDACARGGEPGSLYVIEPDPLPQADHLAAPSLEGHTMTPVGVLRLVKSMGATPPPIVIVGCEPEDLGIEEEGKLGLSPAVAAAVDQAVQLVESLISKIRGGRLEYAPAAHALSSQ